MSNVNISGDLILGSINLCTGIIERLSVSQAKIQSKYKNAGNAWNDSKYRQLGNIINDCDSSIRKTLYGLNECLASLNEIEQILMEYESVNLDGYSSPADGNASLRTSERGASDTNELRTGLMRRLAATLTALLSALTPLAITLSENEERIQNDIPIIRRIREISEGQGAEEPWVRQLHIRLESENDGE